MHRLLKRQLKRHKLDFKHQEEALAFLRDVNRAYKDHDQEKDIIERSLDLTSEELNERNRVLRSKLALLETTHNKLEDSMSVLNSIFDSTGEAILGFDKSGRLLRENHMAQKMFGDIFATETSFNPQSIRKLLRVIPKPQYLLTQFKALKNNSKIDLSGILELKSGQILEFHSSAQIINQKLHGRVWCFRDVTKEKENELLLKHRAYHDSLTSLPNRLLLLDRLSQNIHRANRDNSIVAVLFIDLDGFKKVNDTLGHTKGDILLIDVAERISSNLRESDTLGRLGGDEFVVIISVKNNTDIVSKISTKIIKSLQSYFKIDNNKYYISSSIGISLYPNDSLNSEELIRKADLAMYSAKKSGGSCFRFFDKELEKLAYYSLNLENKLRVALDKKQLEIYYQPKVHLSDNKLNEAEALLRWTTSSNQIISPAQFIPLAEKIGLIVEIGYWVIETVAKQIAYWKTNVQAEIKIAINLSAHQIKEHDFVEKVNHILKKHNLSGKEIDWEITESILLEDFRVAHNVLESLKRLGSTISIDDFGTGYSSLQYIQKLPVDCLKIDRSFILELGTNPTKDSLVSGIISLAHNIQLCVVAEGVENKQIVDYLTLKNCDYIQGFYYYKPMSSNSITKLFKTIRIC